MQVKHKLFSGTKQPLPFSQTTGITYFSAHFLQNQIARTGREQRNLQPQPAQRKTKRGLPGFLRTLNKASKAARFFFNENRVKDCMFFIDLI